MPSGSLIPSVRRERFVSAAAARLSRGASWSALKLQSTSRGRANARTKLAVGRLRSGWTPDPRPRRPLHRSAAVAWHGVRRDGPLRRRRRQPLCWAQQQPRGMDRSTAGRFLCARAVGARRGPGQGDAAATGLRPHVVLPGGPPLLCGDSDHGEFVGSDPRDLTPSRPAVRRGPVSAVDHGGQTAAPLTPGRPGQEPSSDRPVSPYAGRAARSPAVVPALTRVSESDAFLLVALQGCARLECLRGRGLSSSSVSSGRQANAAAFEASWAIGGLEWRHWKVG
jgi:hypothetical protein